MKEVETRPGKTYAVESAGEVTITNTETGAIAAQGDGSGQVLFTACANSYTVSDDAAKVVELFKLAPRLKLALLQGGAGGWLPKGFTELEYLESSGTQFIRTGIMPDNETGGRVKWSLSTIKNYSQVLASTYANSKNIVFGPGLFFMPHFNSPENGFLAAFMDRTTGVFYTTANPSPGEVFISELNFRNSRTASFNGILMGTFPALPSNFCPELALFGLNNTDNSPTKANSLIGRIYAATLTQGANVSAEFLPVLRISDGAVGMFDRVSKQFFVNNGTGSFGYRIKRTGETVAPMSLRDPWRVAPSGVYARVNGENALDIVADTEPPTGEGWEWFSNTAEAYAHFGIEPQEEEFLTE